MRRAAVLFLTLCCAAGAPLAAEGDLQRRQAEARREQESLRARIGKLEKEIAGGVTSRRDVTVELKKSEIAISELDRRLETLAADTRQASDGLRDVQRRTGEQSIELQKRQAHLAEQLRAQYAGGLSPWAALLSGEDPQDIARELGYLEYVSRAQADAVRAVRQTLDDLAALQTQAKAHEADLGRLAAETRQRRAELDEQRAERVAVLERIDKELKQQRGEAKRLAGNEERLGKLVDALGVAIEEEAAEARRRAEEERRLAEERRIAEQERQAEEKRRLAAVQAEREARERESREQASRKVEEARQAAQAVRAEQAEAEAERARADAAPAETRITGRVDGVAADAPPARTPGTASATTAPAVAALTPSASQAGLGKGLPYPVRGEVQGRFGMERPEGGTWRGIVLRASEGTRVAAVAPGRVVFADWLSGFGNLLIIDHGAKYLSVYAYNQGLLKQVGDQVRASEAVATVGATGGQVEPGLYFEIRHEGKPVNPLLWLGK